ncbi:MAG: DNA-formamidopyrimidine glycosylase family protein [Calditrichaceae bacterium]
MPELPDVEIFRRYVDSTSLHREIQNLNIYDNSMLGDISGRSIQMRLKGRKLESTLRHGKYLFIKTNKGEWLVLHFGMTGYLNYAKNGSKPSDHLKLLIEFNNGYHLAYYCQRKLGLIDLIESTGDFINEKELGIDPYSEKFDFNTYRKMAGNSRGTIKYFLMDQSIMAGIGNIYSDEILFHAGIRPKSKSNKLDDHANELIFENMNEVFSTAIKNKAKPDSMPDSYLITHRNPGEKCPVCDGKIKKEKVSGRSSYYCPQHQKLII